MWARDTELVRVRESKGRKQQKRTAYSPILLSSSDRKMSGFVEKIKVDKKHCWSPLLPSPSQSPSWPWLGELSQSQPLPAEAVQCKQTETKYAQGRSNGEGCCSQMLRKPWPQQYYEERVTSDFFWLILLVYLLLENMIKGWDILKLFSCSISIYFRKRSYHT